MSISPVPKDIKRRGDNYKYYHYKIFHNDEVKYYKTLKNIYEDLGISRANIWLMIKNPEVVRRKYNNIKVEKCHLHYLHVDHGIDINLIK